MKNMILILKMAKEHVSVSLIKSKDSAKDSKPYALQGNTENNSLKLTRFCTKKDPYVI